MKALPLLLFCLGLETVLTAQVIVGFDLERGGEYSLQAQTSTQAAISAALPKASFGFTPAVTPAVLNGVAGVVIVVPFDNFSPISPLTTTEQGALLGFVKGGGFAVILADSSYNTTNDGFTAPLGLGVDNNNPSQISIINPHGNPISNGPFGLVTSLQGIAAGELVSLPKPFVPLAKFSNGAIAGGYFLQNALGPGSGAVLFISDANVFHSNWASSDNYKLLSNFVTVAAVPEPSTWSLLIAGAGVAAMGRIIRRQRRRAVTSRLTPDA